MEVDELSIEGVVAFSKHLQDKESVELAEQMKKGVLHFYEFLIFAKQNYLNFNLLLCKKLLQTMKKHL